MSAQRKNFPYEIQPLSPEEMAKPRKHFNSVLDYVKVGPKGYTFTVNYKKEAADIYNMQLKPGDIFVASYPRSGTTWTQELVWLIANDLDYETAKTVPLTIRYTFIEFLSIAKMDDFIKTINNTDDTKNHVGPNMFTTPGTEILAGLPSPRFIKTHLPMSLLPPKTLDTAKMVYVARDPRDAVVSFYHQNKLFKHVNFTGDFKAFWKLFINDLILWTPYFEHLKEAWEMRHHPNMLFLFYEELSKDLPGMVRRVSEFLGKQLTDEQVAGLYTHLSFDNFKKNNSVNYHELKSLGVLIPDESFIRKGKVDGWREYFDADMTAQAQRWMDDNLRDTDLRFPHLSD